MHIFGLYFGWPNGAAWGNVFAMPLCGILAGVAAYLFRDRIGRALSSWWHRHFGHRAELAEIKNLMAAHHAEQMAAHDRRHADLKAHITATVAAAVPQKRLAPRIPGVPAKPYGDTETGR